MKVEVGDRVRLRGQYMEGYTGVVVTTNRVLRTAKVRLDPPLKVLGLHKSVHVNMGNIWDNYGPVVKPPPRDWTRHIFTVMVDTPSGVHRDPHGLARHVVAQVNAQAETYGVRVDVRDGDRRV